MLFIEVAFLSIVIALIRRGQIFRLADLQIRQFWLVFVPLGILVISLLFKKLVPANIWIPVTGGLHIVTTIALFAFFWSNRRLPGIKWMLAGWLLNFIPIISNGGKMPVSKWAVGVVSHGNISTAMTQHTWITSKTHFPFLADTIPGTVPPLIFPEVASPGDVLLAIGIFLLIQLTMCPKRGQESGVGGR